MAPLKRAAARKRPPLKKESAPAPVTKPQRKKPKPIDEPRIKATDFDEMMRRALSVAPEPKAKPRISRKKTTRKAT